MIVLDTNVFSEITKAHAARQFTDWINRQRIGELYTTTVTEAEISAGIHKLTPEHPRFARLQSATIHLFETVLRGRILPFDRSAAAAFGPIWAKRHRAGLANAPADLQIAAIALSQDMLVATRNTRDFLQTGVRLVNPWDPA